LVAIPLNLLFVLHGSYTSSSTFYKTQFKASQISTTWSERMKPVPVCLGADISQLSAVAAKVFARE